MKSEFKNTELFVDYDIQRLKCYSSINKDINIMKDEDGVYLSFKDVKYFNYSVLKSEKIDKFIEKSFNYYNAKNIKQYKLLIRNTEKIIDYQNYMQRNLFKTKDILLIYELEDLNKKNIENKVTMNLVNDKTIKTFTETYLRAFGSDEKNTIKVVRNFSYLLENPDIKLFLVNDKYSNNIGISGIYKRENKYFLSAGAILPEYRYMGYHKDILLQRINNGIEENASLIYSWAYKDSISAENMKKIGMINTSTYSIYEF